MKQSVPRRRSSRWYAVVRTGSSRSQAIDIGSVSDERG